ncbi:hypothetical protein C6P41_002771, partial [Kluyveromyces marxianus]
METDSSSSKPDGYHGLDSKTEEHIKDLARTLSRTSLNRQISLQASGNGASKFDEIKSIFSSSYSGVNPVFLDPSAPGYDARLDPNSEHFSSAAWIKNMVAFSMQDPDYYKHYTIGCCWKDLRAFGDSNDVSYQSTVTTLPGKYLGKIKRHFSATKEEDLFDILKPMDGL